ncbi:Coenzyme F420 hydrogenase/dehydrogenase, beta subunit C-terminal domain [Loktanella sp. SALINAS62]|uniref:Coenzyme F420 hydrogenase/dehydrogenase, beta subunit C-terminal domain n=1 Tax=Loktanella sp. SALINAS62 TaxID=2706124 RepID=UPI001B8AF42D|nr:Coenzyme F420 hydrogenase/dehydrogenase, beta subunit C-terminal domain [Loktanella sp. SALINAS62]MBS1301051.1 coenzyme F420 hydrogenase [Loktanella sp. SALINAS62]
MDLTADHLRSPAHRNLCTDCGVSRMADPSACGTACQFIAPDYPAQEQQVHGRVAGTDGDEAFFGVTQAMYRAAMVQPRDGAQWTGITTSLAASLLRAGTVDAVLACVPDAADRWAPVPAILTDPDDLVRARGMRMGYAPLLAALEPAVAAGHRRIAVVGIPCQVFALRALEKRLGLDLYVIGTPCSDNTTTAHFHDFLGRLTDRPGDVTYLEFRADFHVELRFADGTKRLIPFLKLPISDLPDDFFPLTCRTCVDYTNRLADITVGYMAGEGDQWLIVRNARGAQMLAGLGDAVRLAAPGDKGKRQGSVTGFIANTRRAAGGMPLRRMPDWLRPVMGWLMPRIGPKGLEFARARVEMKAAETILHLRRHAPARMKTMIPDHVWRLAAPYDLPPAPGEQKTPTDD